MKPLMDAMKSGDADAVARLLGEHPEWADGRDETGMSPLMFALYLRKPELVSLLESRGARFDIFSASAAGRADVVDGLLRGNKSLVKLMSHDGWTPLHLAAFFGQPDTARALFNAGADVKAESTNAMQNTPLHAAAAGRGLEAVKLLVDWGSDVNACQHGGWTPLHAAAQNGDIEMAEVLLKAGADPLARAENNQNALDLALGRGHQTMVELLEKHGAKL